MEGEEDFAIFAAPKQPIRKAKLEVADAVTTPKVDAKSFKEMLDPWQVETLSGLRINSPTAIQQACIPAIQRGCSVMAAAQTGSGKTAAFALPILQRLARDPWGIYGLILTPTRELALQIGEQLMALGKSIKVQVQVVLGGMDMMEQAQQLAKRPHVVVATPGRLADLLESSGDALFLKNLAFLVFDEADRLLDPESSFVRLGEIAAIAQRCPKACQRLYLSATQTAAVENYAREHLGGAELFQYWHTRSAFETASTIDERFMLVPSQVRDVYLVHVLKESLANHTCIIFVGKCKTAELVVRMLRELKMRVVGLHSRMSQTDRIAALARFRSGLVPILVATDVGSRGLDIPSVQAVINFDLPADARDYVHRIGRTGRAGRKGLALSFVHEIDISILRNIETKIGHPLAEYERMPPEREILNMLNKVTVAKRTASMILHERKFGEKQEHNQQKWSKAKSVE